MSLRPNYLFFLFFEIRKTGQGKKQIRKPIEVNNDAVINLP